MTDHIIARDQLRAFIERVERLESEKSAISEDIKDVYAEAKGQGFDPKIMRQIVRIRKQDPNERSEQEALLDVYKSALGMQSSFDFEGVQVGQPTPPDPRTPGTHINGRRVA